MGIMGITPMGKVTWDKAPIQPWGHPCLMRYLHFPCIFMACQLHLLFLLQMMIKMQEIKPQIAWPTLYGCTVWIRRCHLECLLL